MAIRFYSACRPWGNSPPPPLPSVKVALQYPSPGCLMNCRLVASQGQVAAAAAPCEAARGMLRRWPLGHLGNSDACTLRHGRCGMAAAACALPQERNQAFRASVPAVSIPRCAANSERRGPQRRPVAKGPPAAYHDTRVAAHAGQLHMRECVGFRCERQNCSPVPNKCRQSGDLPSHACSPCLKRVRDKVRQTRSKPCTRP